METEKSKCQYFLEPVEVSSGFYMQLKRTTHEPSCLHSNSKFNPKPKFSNDFWHKQGNFVLKELLLNWKTLCFI